MKKKRLPLKNSQQTKELCISAVLPHDPAITRAMINGQAITEYANNEFTEELTRIWQQMLQSLKKP